MYILNISSAYANIQDLTTFETYYKQIVETNYGYESNNNAIDNLYFRYMNLLSSNVWETYKNNIPFENYQNCIVRTGLANNGNNTQRRIDIFLFDTNTTFYVTSDGTLKTNENINMNYAISFFCNEGNHTYVLNWERYNNWNWNTDHISFKIQPNINMTSFVFIDNLITNESSYTIIGKNYTIMIVVPNTTTYISSEIQQYRLGERIYRKYIL